MLKRKIYLPGLLTLVALLALSFALPSTPTFANGSRPEAGWDGVWQTSWTIMEYGEFNTHQFTITITQSGNMVTGTSNYYGWGLTGTVSGNTMIGTWSAFGLPDVWDPATGTYISAPHKSGQLYFVLDPSGRTFTGLFKGEFHWVTDVSDPSTWDQRFVVYGEKSGYTPTPPPPPPPPPPPSPPPPTPTPTPSTSKQFTGKWDSDWGEMNLSQVGNTLTGTYDYEGGKIQGTVDGNIASGTWSEADSYQPPLDAGDFMFILSADGRIISGQWRYGSCDWDGDIMGTRAEQPTPPTPTGDWTGTWGSNWGDMTLTQNGNQVTGTYTHDNGRISATVSGNTLRGIWSEAPSYAPPDDAGEMVFTMSADGQSFTGDWRYGSSGDWYSGGWKGTKTSPPETTVTPIVGLKWDGNWNTDWGEMQLSQSGEQVTGTYEYENGQIEGTASGDKLTGTWSKSPSYAEPKDAGTFEFQISKNRMEFIGNWRYASCGWNGDWDATLVEPDVIGVNRPPIASFVTTPQAPITSDTVIAISQSYDPDGDTLSYTWSFDAATASQYNNVPYFIRQNPAAGVHTIHLLINDGKGGTASYQAQITVSKAPQPTPPGPTPGTNQFPIASFSITPQAPTTSDTIVANSTSTDPDGDTLTYSWYRDGIQANEYNNMPYCIWANPTAGTHVVSLMVSDGKGGTASTQTQVNVTQPQPQPGPSPVPGVNTPPKAYFVIEPPQPEAGGNINIVSQSTDADGDKLGFTWYLDGQLLNEYADSASWKWKKPPAGGHFMRLEVNDGKGGQDAYSKKIKITGEDTDGSGGFPEINITIPQCFIATAAYGSPTAEELDTLRAFRDEVLLQSEPGRAFVELYYKVSPPAAAFIASNETIRTLVREMLLDPIVFVVAQTQGFWNGEAGAK